MRSFFFAVVLLAVFCTNNLRSEIVGIRILPEIIDLTYRDSTQQLTVQTVDANGTTCHPLDTTSLASVSDVHIATVSPSQTKNVFIVSAKASGQTKLTIEGKLPNGQVVQATATILCNQTEQQGDLEFENHVQAVLARNGCNMGACHGALAGKGGFRLSLRGYDPTSDHFNMTRQARGRRVETAEPGKSLLIAKPSGAIEHKGGVRLPADSYDYSLLSRWIANGAVGIQSKDPKLQHLEILPSTIRLTKTSVQSLTVLAHYDNGRTEDVTKWAKFSATDEAVAVVDEHGTARVVGPGEGAVNAWFASRIVTARIRVPFNDTASEPVGQLPIANKIDQHVSTQLASLGLSASERCSDSEFIRRSALDATGSLPTEQQVREFLSDTREDKRKRWVDSLLESPEYVDYWTYRWSDLMMLNSNLLRADGLKSYYGWIRNHVQNNTPWDQFAREIVTARGEALDNGATNFYAINQDPESMTENICQAFLGLSIGCAKCHNHPLEKWTNDQYYSMANMFARVRAKGWGGETRDGDSARTVLVLDQGDLIQPLRGKPQPPAPLDSQPLDINATSDRREALANWLVAPENPYFTRAIVNRIWAAHFGVGIVNPVDDLRASNPASNPELMNALCDHLVASKYNLKDLIKLILNSETYQRSSLTSPGNNEDKKYFSHYYPKRLMAEVIHDSIVKVSTIPTEFNKVSFLGGDKRDTKFYKKGTLAIQLFDSSVDNSFLKTFGRNQRRITCECERSDEPSIIQVLNLNNGDTLNSKLTEPGSVVDQLLEQFPNDFQGLITSAYLRCLAREPSASELTPLIEELNTAEDDQRRLVVEDLLWCLMTSREFLFNH